MNSLLRLAVVFAAVLAAAAAHAQSKPVKVNMRLDWKPGAQHATFYYAREKGYYAQEGIDLNIIPGSGSSDSVKQLGSRAIDVALVDALVLVQAAEQRVPVKSIAAYYQRTPITLMSPKAKPVTNVQQLLGDVKLGSKKGSSTYQGLVALLGANNIKLEQIKLMDIGFGVQPLLVKQVDAIMGFTMNEPIEAETQGMPIHEILIADHGVNAYGLTISSNDDFIAKQGELLTRFLRATKKAVIEEASARPAAIQAVVKAVPEVDAAREMKVLDRTLPFYAPKGGDLNSFGTQTEQAWQQTIDTAKRLGLVETAPSTRALYNASLLK
jgi:NitT/TauT family transport system substrate-binding protein